MKLRIASLSLLTILCLALGTTALADDLYNNGPTNGTNDAYFIDVYAVSDSFIPNSFLYSDIQSFDVALWTLAGATPLTIDWAIGTSSFGSDIGSGSGEWGLTLLCRSGQPFNGGVCGGGFGYDLYDANMSTGSLIVTPGDTYWLTLTGAIDNFGGRDGWDVNSGHSSAAYHNLLGAIPSESFTINGHGETTGFVPEPSGILLLGSGVLGLAGIVRRKLL